MKKLVITTLVLLSCGVAYALPLGNPIEASLFLNGAWCESTSCNPCDPCFSWCDAWSVRLGFYGDYVFDRHLEVDANNTDKDIITTAIHTNAGYLAFNVCDRADFFATLGTSRISLMSNSRAWGDPAAQTVLNRVEFSTEFSWSVGGRATLWDCGCFGVGVEGQYFRTKPKLSYSTFHSVLFDDGELFYFDDNETCYQEWQVGLGVSYRFTTNCPSFAMVPYAGVKWARSNFDIGVPLPATSLFFNDLESKKRWGYAVGMSFTLCEMIGVTVEGRFADEKAVYVDGQFRF